MHVGAEVAQEKDFSRALTLADFAKKLKLVPTPQAFWAGREEPSSMEYIKLRQRKLGEPFWVAAVSRPDIRAR